MTYVNKLWISYLIMVLLIFGLGLKGFSQSEASVSGRLVEQESGDPLPSATIAILMLQDSILITGSFTDEDGRFTFQGIKPGHYLVRCSYVGFTNSDIPLFISDKNDVYDIGKIVMNPQFETLREVVVESERAVVSGGLDKKSFDVSDNISQSGGSVLDAMRNLPGIHVDQEGKVLLRGSDKVVVLIDGKQSSITGFGNQKGLDHVPASNVDRIEIINNPSSKYDATGMAGIINIIYKKENQKGWNGDLGLAVGIADISPRKDDLPTDLGGYHANQKLIPSLNVNYRESAFNFFLQSEVLFQKKLPNNEFTTRNYLDGQNTISQVPENRTQTHTIVRSGIDWNPNERNKLSFSTIIDYESHIDTAQIPYIDVETNRRYRYWHWKEDEVTGFMNFSLIYEHLFKEIGHQIHANLQYTRGWEDEQYFLNDSSIYRQSTDRTHIVAKENTSNLSIDYIKPLFSGKLEAGVKLQLRTIPVTYEIGHGDLSIIYPGLGSWSDWGENTYGAYLNFLYEKPSWDIEAGFRLEHTDVHYDIDPVNIYYAQNDSYNYFRIYPNVRISLLLNERNHFSLFYNNRVDRPGEPNLRIFPKYDDPELLKVGNPYVRPQFTQTFEAAYKHIWTTGSVFFATYYRNITDPFIRIYSKDESQSQYDIINKIYQNVGQGSNAGIELLLTQNVKDFWKISTSFNAFQNKIDKYNSVLLFPYERTFQIPNSTDFTWDLKINSQWDVNQRLQFQLSGIYLAPKNTPQGKALSRASLDIGCKINLLEEQVEFTLSAVDVFNTFGLREEIQTQEFNALYENYFETQVFRAGLKYKFK